MGKQNIKKLESEKFLQLFEEVYHEIQDERNRAMLMYKRISAKMKEEQDIVQLGKSANDFLKLVDNSHDKKIKLLRLYADMIKQNPEMATKNVINQAAELNDAETSQELAQLAKKLGLDVNMLNDEYKK